MTRPRRVLSYGKRHGNLRFNPRFDAVDSSILVFVQAVSDIFANFADYLYKSGCALD
jgi:stringent starvation protein B